MKLTSKQRQHFDDHGYVVVPAGLRPVDLAPVRKAYDDFIGTEATRLHAEGALTSAFSDEPFERRLARICEQDTSIYGQIDLMYCRLRGVFEFLRNPPLLDLIEGIVGPEIICSPIQHARAKLPQSLLEHTQADDDTPDALKGMVAENVAPWHQDAQVHLEVADPCPIVTVWVPLVDATADNGCLQVIPDVHHRRTVYWSKGFGISAEQLPDDAIVTLPMQAGDVLLMDKLIPHRSTPNHTDSIRWSLDLRYQRTGTPTGRDDYPVFVARSRDNPDGELTSYEQWCRQWAQALERIPLAQRPRRSSPPTSPQTMEIQP